MQRLDRMKLSRICADDIIRDPGTGRQVRVVDMERGNTYTGIAARDLETDADVIVTVRNSVRLTVWTD